MRQPGSGTSTVSLRQPPKFRSTNQSHPKVSALGTLWIIPRPDSSGHIRSHQAPCPWWGGMAFLPSPASKQLFAWYPGKWAALHHQGMLWTRRYSSIHSKAAGKVSLDAMEVPPLQATCWVGACIVLDQGPTAEWMVQTRASFGSLA